MCPRRWTRFPGLLGRRVSASPRRPTAPQLDLARPRRPCPASLVWCPAPPTPMGLCSIPPPPAPHKRYPRRPRATKRRERAQAPPGPLQAPLTTTWRRRQAVPHTPSASPAQPPSPLSTPALHSPRWPPHIQIAANQPPRCHATADWRSSMHTHPLHTHLPWRCRPWLRRWRRLRCAVARWHRSTGP